MTKYAIIVAAGTGVRMGGPVPKQFLLLRGKPLLWHTLTVFLNTFSDLEVILVLPQDHLENGLELKNSTTHPDRIRLVAGGATRFHSVKNGLDLVLEPSIVFVHDGVRCLVSSDLIKRCYAAALEHGNAIPAIMPVDSLRIQTIGGSEPIDRSRVRIIQTPQTFQSHIIKRAFEQPYEEAFTDEASVAEKQQVKIHLIEGEATNIKITRPVDLVLAEKLLE